MPGLVIARARPDLRIVLIDRRSGRADHISRLIRRLGLADRVTVLAGDASHVVLDVPVDAVTARGFGPPATTLLAAARLVRPGGTIVISEPPAAERGPLAATLLGRAGVSRCRGRPSGRRVPAKRRSTWNMNATLYHCSTFHVERRVLDRPAGARQAVAAVQRPVSERRSEPSNGERSR